MRIRYFQQYFVYIITNPRKTVLYTGMTNDLKRRLDEHFNNRGSDEHFAGKYFCYKLLYYEIFDSAEQAINRENEIKDLSRERKIDLIKTTNTKMNFLIIE